jgi:cell division protein FtsB
MADYEQMCRSVRQECRSLDASSVALQKEDLSNNLEVVKYSLADLLNQRNSTIPEVARGLKDSETEVKLNDAEEVVRKLQEQIEANDKISGEFKTKVEELERKIKALEASPASNPTKVVEEKLTEDEVKRNAFEVLRNSKDRSTIAQVILKNLQ